MQSRADILHVEVLRHGVVAVEAAAGAVAEGEVDWRGGGVEAAGLPLGALKCHAGGVNVVHVKAADGIVCVVLGLLAGCRGLTAEVLAGGNDGLERVLRDEVVACQEVKVDAGAVCTRAAADVGADASIPDGDALEVDASALHNLLRKHRHIDAGVTAKAR